MDRTDDIRTAVRRAKDHGHAAQLRVALELIPADSVEAQAIIGNVLRDLEPPTAAPMESP